MQKYHAQFLGGLNYQIFAIEKYTLNFKTMKHIICILISGLIFISSYAQPESVEMTHYLFPEYTKGVILMKDGTKHESLLNYNSLSEEMIFENNGKKLAIAKVDIPLLDTVFIKDRKFITFNSKFFELLYHSKWDIYVEHKCKLNKKGKPSGYGGTSKTTSIKTYSSLYSEGNMHKLKSSDGYEIEPYTHYLLRKNGELNRFTNMRELKKFYKDRKDLFKACVKMYGAKYNNQESIVKLIEYLESNQNKSVF